VSKPIPRCFASRNAKRYTKQRGSRLWTTGTTRKNLDRRHRRRTNLTSPCWTNFVPPLTSPSAQRLLTGRKLTLQQKDLMLVLHRPVEVAAVWAKTPTLGLKSSNGVLWAATSKSNVGESG